MPNLQIIGTAKIKGFMNAAFRKIGRTNCAIPLKAFLAVGVTNSSHPAGQVHESPSIVAPFVSFKSAMWGSFLRTDDCST